MKNHLNAHETSRHFLNLALTLCLAFPLPSLAAVALATSPLATSSTSSVSPNVMFMLDDSGSMDWDYMPDDAKAFAGKYGFNSNHCNGVYYNPLITYNPPVDSAGKSYADSTSASYVNNTFTNAQTDGYNVGTTVNLDTGFTGGSGTGSSGINLTPSKAFYYTYSGTQTSGVQMDFHNTNSVFYKECNSAIGSTTAVDGTNPVNTLFTLVRLASTENATITVTAPGSGATSTSVDSIKVGSVELLSALPASSSSASTLAANIAAKITLSGFSATAVGSAINIIAPTSANGYTPVIHVASGNLTFAANQFPDTDPAKLQNFANWYSYYSTRMLMMKTGVGQAFAPITDKYRVGFMTMNNNVSPDIVELDSFNAAQKSAWYTKLYASNPGNSTPLREALSNVGRLYAHQFTDQTIYTATIKVSGSTTTSVSSIQVNGVELLAGTSTGSNKSSSVAKNIVSQFIDPSDYTAAASSSTITITGPAAASGYAPNVTCTVMPCPMTFTVTSFAGKTILASLNGIDPKDPVQYSCQQNFVILSTDGYWNGATDYDLSSPTAKPVGNQDGSAPRPMYDGASYTKVTSQTYQTTTQVKKSTSQILKRTTQLQSSTSNLQSSTADLQSTAYALQSSTADLQSTAYALQSSTADLQSTAYALQSSTAALQQQVYPLMSSMADLQSTAYALQSSTAALQQQVYPLQSVVSNLQTKTSQLQSQTSTLMGTVAEVLMSCSDITRRCGTAPATGIPGLGTGCTTSGGSATTCTTSWVAATSCNTGSGTTSPRCAVITPSSTLTQAVTSKCNTGATITGTTNFSSSNTDGGYLYSSCTYTAWSSVAGVPNCSTVNQGANPNNTTVVTASTCNTLVTSDWADAVGTCTTNATPTSSGYTTNCRYNTPNPTPSTVSNCTYQNRSAASPYSVLTETICSYAATSPTSVTTVTSCTPTQSTSTANNAVWSPTGYACGYAAYTAAAPAALCTYQNKSASAPYAGPAVTCSYAATSPTVTSVTSCTPVAYSTSTTNGAAWSSTAHTCGYAAYTAAAPAASCTYQNQSGAAPYSGPAVTCSYNMSATPATTTVTSCTPTQSTSTTTGTAWSPTGYACGYAAYTAAAPAASCTYQNKSASAPYAGPAVTCSYAATSPTVTSVTSCTPVAYSSSTTNGAAWSSTAHTCGYAAYTPAAPAASCTYQNKSASAPYAGPAVTCSYAATSPTVTSVTTCTPVAYSTSTTNGAAWSSTAHTCGYAAYTAAAPAASCTYQNKSASAPYAGPAVTCSYAATSPTVTSVTTCTPVAYSTSTTNGAAWSSTAHTCGYAAYTAATNVSSCTNVSKSASAPYAGPAVTCSYTPYTAYGNVSSCTPVAQDLTNPFDMTASGGVATNCQTTDTGWVGAPSCALYGPTNGLTVNCMSPVVTTTGPTPVTSCTAGTSSCPASGPYTASTCMTTSCTTTTNGPTLVASCTPVSAGVSNSYTATTCSTTTLSSVAGASCTPGNTGSPNYIQTTCTATTPATGTSDTLADVAMYYYQTDLRNPALNNCTGGASSDFPSGTDVCQDNVFISGLDNNVKQHMTTYTLGLGARGRMVYTSKDYMNDTSGDFYSVKTGATTNLGVSPPICSWQTTGACNWPIPSSGSIANIDDLWHAAVNGRGTYFSATDPAALSDGLSSALSSITARKGAAAAAATSTLNPVAGNNFAYVASYTTVKWTGNLEARTINTVNGVIDKTASWCVENLTSDTCADPSTIVADASGNSTVYNCVTPNSTAASCTYPSVFDSATKNCSLQMALSCNGTMPSLVGSTSDTRKIYTANGPANFGTTLGLVNFVYANLNSADFDATRISALSQWPALTATQQANAVGANLVNYLRGQNGYEDRAVNLVGAIDNRIYRYREAVMGDALESQPSYIGAPTFSYADTGYSAFVSAHASRPGMVYMGTNDGMLHAFHAQDKITYTAPAKCVIGAVAGEYCGGEEAWAFVPSMVVSNMWKLADKDYGTKHVNFINGSPIISDFYCTQDCGGLGGAPSWRTILVGGLSGGGRGYYALDITDPTAPTLLWEFTASKAAPYGDANLGYSFGLPVVTKMADGKWVVLVTSGYDNGTDSSTPKTSPLTGFVANSPAGDGIGRIYVLDAQSGAIVKTISTGAGSASAPSGLAKIAAWNGVPSSNQASYIYGGDLLGNVWRFDINSSSSPFLLAALMDPLGNPQPVTTSPTLGEIIGKRVIFVGTGQYLEKADLSNHQVETLYAIKDDDATVTLFNPRTYSTAVSPVPRMVQQTITPSGSIRTGSKYPVSFVTDRGWFIDFPDAGERVNIDSKLVLGVLLVPTIVPSSTVCSPGGYGWLNFFDYTDGWPTTDPTGDFAAANNTNVSVKYDATIVGMNILYIEGKPIIEVVTSDNPTPTQPQNPPPISPPPSNFTGKRMQWRELIP